MSNFSDFDLDLKKVKKVSASCGDTSIVIKTLTQFSKYTIEHNCLGTSDVPTTGYSTVCCHSNAEDSEGAEPNCI